MQIMDNSEKEKQQVMNEEELFAVYAENIKQIAKGEIVIGKVISRNELNIIVDIGYKSEGVIPVSEFENEDVPELGEKIEVLIESLEDEEGMVIISKKKADKIYAWSRIISNFKEGDIIEGRVIRKVKGGLMVDIGVESFLPASLVSLRGYSNMDQLLGEKMLFEIIKINRPRKNIVVSRKDYLVKEREEKRKKLMSELEGGKIVKGKVKNITDFGAFINLGGIDGLLHITDMSWGRISHPSEMLAVGDEIEVVILDYKKEEGRISLGLKQKTSNPWLDIEKKYPVGTKVKAKVVNLVQYGAFIELEKGIEGLVHISELSWTKRISDPSEILAIGDVVEAVVLNIDKDNQKISLGIKQTEVNPWEDISTRYSVGAKVKGKVRNIVDYGIFVELEEGIDGFIHNSDISWTNKNVSPSKLFKKGQKVEAVILKIDSEGRRISAGLKQLTPNPWAMIAQRYGVGVSCEANVSRITPAGIFAEIETNLEGFIPLNEGGSENSPELVKKYNVGDKINVEVLKLDVEEGKIILGLK